MKTDWLLLVAGSPSAPTSGTPGMEWWRLVVLLIIFGLLLGIWWWVNRGRLNFQNLMRAREQQIQVEEQRWLNAHSCILLVQVGSERFLLAQGQHGVAWQKLAAREDSVPKASPPPPPPSPFSP